MVKREFALSSDFPLPSFDPWAYAANGGTLDIEGGGDGLVIVAEIILHDEEDILRGGESAVAALPLLPALRAQLGEVVHQALLFFGSGLGDALALLQLAVHLLESLRPSPPFRPDQLQLTSTTGLGKSMLTADVCDKKCENIAKIPSLLIWFYKKCLTL